MFTYWEGEETHDVSVERGPFFRGNGLTHCVLGGDILGVEFLVVEYSRLQDQDIDSFPRLRPLSVKSIEVEYIRLQDFARHGGAHI